jgi:acetyl esterase
MRPTDARYVEISRPETTGIDATVGCVVLCWPVIDPLGRYLYAKEAVAAGGDYPENLPRVLPSHDKFWGSEDAMSEASPVRMLERGEDVVLPPVLYVQGDADKMHPRAHLDRFVALYREKGGALDLALYEGEAAGFVTRAPKKMENQVAGTERIIAFIHEQLG